MLDRWQWHKTYRPIEHRLVERSSSGLSVERTAEGRIPTNYGWFNIVSYLERESGEEDVALYQGDITTSKPLLTRLHSACITAETFGALNCDCKEQMTEAMIRIGEEKRGLIVYMHQEGRGNGLASKILQLRTMFDMGVDTVTAFETNGQKGENRQYKEAVDIYRDLGIVAPLRMMTHNPGKIESLGKAGFQIIIEPFTVPINGKITATDLRAKENKLGHLY